MKKFLWLFVLMIAAGIGVTVAVPFLSLDQISGMCENNIIEEVQSPDGIFKAVIFERNCGATTGLSTQVSIIAAEAALQPESGNIFVIDNDDGAAPQRRYGGPNIWVRWPNPKLLQITYDKRAATFEKKARYRGIEIVYKPQ